MIRHTSILIGLTLLSCLAAFAENPNIAIVPTPEPGTIFMMATGLISGAGYMAWKRRRKQ